MRTGRAAVEVIELVQVAAAEGATACKRSRSKVGVQIPNWFVLRSGEDPSPLSHLVGQRTDLGVYLDLLLLAKAPNKDGRHTLTIWPRDLARLFGRSPYDPKAARSMRDSLSRLADLAAIEVTRPHGNARPAEIRLLDWNTANPGNYQRPTSRYLTLHNGFWTNGWQAVLTSRALAMLLISIHQHNWANPEPESGPGAIDKSFWISPGTADTLYGLHADTRSRGWQELQSYGLVTKSREPIQSSLDPRRKRNTYDLNLSRLKRPPFGKTAPTPSIAEPRTSPFGGETQDAIGPNTNPLDATTELVTLELRDHRVAFKGYEVAQGSIRGPWNACTYYVTAKGQIVTYDSLHKRMHVQELDEFADSQQVDEPVKTAILHHLGRGGVQILDI